MKPRALAYPDLILFNGKIRSFARDDATYEAVACAGARIVATGKSDDVRRLAGPEAFVRGLVLPLPGGAPHSGREGQHVLLDHELHGFAVVGGW